MTAERLDILRAADAVLQEEIRRAGLYRRSLAELRRAAAIKSVGVQGDERTYAYPVVIRAVTSEDAMTARLGAAPLRRARDDLEPDHQRGARREPGRARPLVEAAGDDRVGVTASRSASC